MHRTVLRPILFFSLTFRLMSSFRSLNCLAADSIEKHQGMKTKNKKNEQFKIQISKRGLVIGTCSWCSKLHSGVVMIASEYTARSDGAIDLFFLFSFCVVFVFPFFGKKIVQGSSKRYSFIYLVCCERWRRRIVSCVCVCVRQRWWRAILV